MSTRTNILYVIPSLGRRGTERQLVELLKGLDRSTFTLRVVTLVSTSPCYTADVEELGVPVTCLNCSGKRDYLAAIGSVARLIREHDIRIVHGFLNLGSFVASIAGWRQSVKVVGASIRDSRDSVASLKYYRAVTSRLSDVFTSNSKAGFNNRYATWGDNFKVIYNGINLTRFAKGDDARLNARQTLGVPASHRVIAMVAALSEHKDYPTFIDAAAMVLAQRQDVTFLSMGNGPKSDEYKRYAASAGSPVTFLGNRPDIDQLWPAIDVSVMLTNNRLIEEGLPNSVMESLACGVPAIANDSGGTREVIDHLSNGYLLQPDEVNAESVADIITGWLDSPDTYAELSANAVRKISDAFSYESYIETHQRMYQNLLQG